jgi:hypothetical protein
MSAYTPPQTRLYVLLARAARRALIFRRGPSKLVLLIAWDRATDAFQEGQWFRGHFYERRCDLSPSGELLVYFAAKYKRYISQLGREPEAFPTWTAISRPPYLTALTMWPHSDAWNGGGLFEDDQTLLLNHGARVPPELGQPAPPASFTVRPLGGPHGEDHTIEHARRVRDGWALIQQGQSRSEPAGDLGYVVDPPTIYEKASPPFTLQLQIRGRFQRNGPVNVEEHILSRADRDQRTVLPDSEWADWDTNGDLLFARQGELFRIPAPKLRSPDLGLSAAVQLADFRPLAFTSRRTPPELAAW